MKVSNMAKKDSRLKIAPVIEVVEDFNRTFDTSKIQKARCSFCGKKLNLKEKGSDSFFSYRDGCVCESCAIVVSEGIRYLKRKTRERDISLKELFGE